MDADSSTQRARAAGVVAALCAGYVGIYLCRKNLSVAISDLQTSLHATKAQVGRIAGVATLVYAIGKLALSPVVDRVGGRRGFLFALFAVATLGASGALAPGIGVLTVTYSLSRFFGAAGWPAMMKLTPTWYPKSRTATVAAVLSLSYVAGGVAATLLAGGIKAAGGGWRAIMGWPSLALGAIAAGCFFFVRSGPIGAEPAPLASSPATAFGPGAVAPSALPAGPDAQSSRATAIVSLLVRPQFLVVCALSFALTLMRESFNIWSANYLESLGGTAFHATTFDLAGAPSILLMGFLYDRAPPSLRRWLVAGVLAILTALLFVLAGVRTAGAAAWLVGAVGLLVYGPYSLLAGVLAIESGGRAWAATASGIIDFVGYCAGYLAGEFLGGLLDRGGYPLGFRFLAGVTAVAALLALGLRSRKEAEA